MPLPLEKLREHQDTTQEPAALALAAAPARARLCPTAAGVPEALWRKALVNPVGEILGRPGKGFRRRLVELAYVLGGGAGDPPAALGAMLETLHAGSMIVDDIEDDSDERRGEPAVHRVFGLPIALNAGNWMYFAPFELITELGLSAASELHLRRRMARVLLDCHFGQALDLATRLHAVPQTGVRDVAATISTLKTGRLLALAAEAGALAAGAKPADVAAIAAFGEALGVGLQMLDDLGDLSPHTPRSKRFEDLAEGRVTWPWAWAAELLSERAYRGFVNDRVQAATARDGRLEAFAGRLRHLVAAQGRSQAHWHLGEALRTLRAHLGPCPPARVAAALDGAADEIARLEASYG
jgi:geranylgeranyl pyrophosphate synthase